MNRVLRAVLAAIGTGALAVGAAALIPVTAHRIAPVVAEMTILSLGAIVFIFTASTALCFGLCRVQALHLSDVARSERITTIERGRLTDIYHTKPLAHDGEVAPSEATIAA